MQRFLFLYLILFLFLMGCEESEVVNPPVRQKPVAEIYQEWWKEVSRIDQERLKILSSDYEFTALCDSLDHLLFIGRLSEGEQIDTVFKDYPRLLSRLVDYGLKNDIINILAYKRCYLASRQLLTKEIIVVGNCELKNTWLTVHKTCVFAYQAGLSRFFGTLGCCEPRFRRSIEKAMIYLPDVGQDICNLFHYVVDPALVNFECEYYVNLMNIVGIPPLKRKDKLLELERKIEEIVLTIALDQKMWDRCTCRPGTGGGGGGGGGGGSGSGPSPEGFPNNIPEYIEGEFPPEYQELTYDNKVTFKMMEYMLSEFFSNLNLQWFMDQYSGGEYEYAMSFNRNQVTGKYSRTEPTTDFSTGEVTFKITYDGDPRTVAVIHTHPNEGVHSTHDVITLADMNAKSDGMLSTSMVTLGQDLYILYVKDPAKAVTFFAKCSGQQAQIDHYYASSVILISRQLGVVEMSYDEMSIYARAAVLNQYNTGMVLLRYDREGKMVQYDARYNNDKGIIEMKIIEYR